MQPERGEVWLADLGLAAKVRPVLVISLAYFAAKLLRSPRRISSDVVEKGVSQ